MPILWTEKIKNNSTKVNTTIKQSLPLRDLKLLYTNMGQRPKQGKSRKCSERAYVSYDPY